MKYKYTEDHEWVAFDADGYVTVGITNHAQELLGDVVYVDLPQVGTYLEAKSVAGVVESVKADADIFSPVTGTVREVNSALQDDPSLVNDEPQGDGWLFKIELSFPAELDILLDQEQYDMLIHLHL